ncbi:hypothetical protein [Lacrimispora algidixylanolytica]|uniref:Isopropylmalate dehydrogenase-like domain-containing protein n=1 Tax=Lacrimispora algidixylanolytica TaxID=94868 RepID=A0A419SZN0_9FIRM|nr:hypothetical protein [Lacrimispora algidixylanolytica]RKD30740.1 hypothetical protein BET01_05320 [Lacrimispora algidixylanolytica]
MDNKRVAEDTFGALIQEEYERIKRMKSTTEVTDFGKLNKIIIGILPGDGIGPIIMEQALRVLKKLVRGEIDRGKPCLKQSTAQLPV